MQREATRTSSSTSRKDSPTRKAFPDIGKVFFWQDKQRKVCFPHITKGSIIRAMEKREAFRMKLKKGCKEEYKKRHSELWPSVRDILKKSGVYDYSIYLDEETGTLFAFQKVSGDKGSQDLGSEQAIKEWWHFMAPLMEVNENESPVSIPLEEMFHLD